MNETLIDLYHRHVGMAFDRQQRLAEFLKIKAPGTKGKHDIESAQLLFGSKVEFEAPLLGVHAFHNHSWLWAWSIRHQRLTLTNRALGDTVRMLVHRLGIHELGAAGFSIEPLLGEELTPQAVQIVGVVLGTELGYDAYFVSHSEGSDSLALIRDDRLKSAVKKPLSRILTQFPKLLASHALSDQRAALRGYADDYGITVTEEGGGLKLALGKDHLIAAFDDQGRLTKLEGTVHPEPKFVAKKPKPKPSVKKAKPKVVKTAARKATKLEKVMRAKPVKKVTKPAAKKPGKAVAKKPGRKR